jgi:tRNA/rRNA methyltransferase
MQTAITRFVLVEPSHRGNVGAVARAMKVMGFTDLALVNPRWPDVLTHEEARAMASGATDVLDKANVVNTLQEALRGITHTVATAMTPRDFGPPTVSPRKHLPQLAGTSQSVAFIFGSERFGLSNKDVHACHACVSIPTHPDYGSLNLAQAVQLLAYEWREALGGYDVVPRTADPMRADAPMVAAALAHIEQALVHCKFLDPAVPKQLIPRMQQLANRAQLTHEEVHILRGVANAVLKLKA